MWVLCESRKTLSAFTWHSHCGFWSLSTSKSIHFIKSFWKDFWVGMLSTKKVIIIVKSLPLPIPLRGTQPSPPPMPCSPISYCVNRPKRVHFKKLWTRIPAFTITTDMKQFVCIVYLGAGLLEWNNNNQSTAQCCTIWKQWSTFEI